MTQTLTRDEAAASAPVFLEADTAAEVTFAELGVPAPLVAALVKAGRPTAFPIQIATLPSTLAGRDVLGRGKTGSGKTLAFSIPLVARLAGKLAGGRRSPGRPLGLVLAPTRELATQIAKVVEPLADAVGLKVTTVFGGVSQKPQEEAFRRGVDIVIACPGRLEDLMKQGVVRLDAIEIAVLDEADHMADLGFLPGVMRILNATPKGGQRMLFSATLDNGVDKLVQRFLSDPILHSIDEANSPVPAMTHHVFEVASPEAKATLVQTLASGRGRRILFTRTKHQTKKLAKQLTASGIPAVDLHGNLSQNARDRSLAAFSSGEVRVLVATDVAARGVHVDDVELVVHVDPPAEHKAYLHRSGRTARAGSSGDVATVMLPTQRRDTQQLLRQADIKVQPQQVSHDSASVVELVGERAPHVAPVAGGPGSGNQPAAPQGGSRGGSGSRSGGGAGRGRGRGGQGSGSRAGSAQGSGSASGQGGRGQQAGGRSASSSRSGEGQSSRGGSAQGARSGQPARAGQSPRAGQAASRPARPQRRAQWGDR
ncbi:ATP-dependent RNA helicase RhlE [Pseudoclavibacter triregionum]|nr:ATP-dependent RNA helicase RhlE [Pseudoclavibacter triregionum]